jgi:2-amino-4-hydroxy-6-hydroxymethyldihydropteridine diphosphokinase
MLKLKLDEPGMIYKYYLSLGSNVSPRIFYMKQALAQLGEIGIIKQKSSLYESEPWGKKDQPLFLNAIVSFHSYLPPHKLLQAVKMIEKSSGRMTFVRWGPREIDIDIIFCEKVIINHKDLKIPHENFKRRKFVLLPMMELDKSYRIEGSVNTIETELNNCMDRSFVQQVNINW